MSYKNDTNIIERRYYNRHIQKKYRGRFKFGQKILRKIFWLRTKS